MTRNLYNTDVASVDPVFYPVVPDSFMNRDGSPSRSRAKAAGGAEWPEEVDRPLVSPHDRWSF